MRAGGELNGVMFAAVAAIAYGSNVPFVRQAAHLGVSGADIVFYRGLPSILCFALGAYMLGVSLRVPRTQWRAVAAFAVCATAMILCYLSSVAFIPVSVATIIFYTNPIIVMALSPLIDKRPLTPARIGVFAMAFIGLCVIVGPMFDALDMRGVSLAAGASLCSAGLFFTGARATRSVEPLATGFWAQMLALPAALVVSLATGGPASLAALQSAALPVALAGGLFIAGFMLYVLSARRVAPAALALIFCIEPVASIVTAAWLLDETVTASHLIGGALVLLAVMAGILLDRREAMVAGAPSGRG